jgi:hypothetical protein
MMVQIHNFLNERAWNEVLRLEDSRTLYVAAQGHASLLYEGPSQFPAAEGRASALHGPASRTITQGTAALDAGALFSEHVQVSSIGSDRVALTRSAPNHLLTGTTGTSEGHLKGQCSAMSSTIIPVRTMNKGPLCTSVGWPAQA